MKIIQLITGQDGDGSHVLYGLGDDGCVYESWTRQEPRIVHRKRLVLKWMQTRSAK